MPREELGRRAVLVGAGCAALAALGACKSNPTPSSSAPSVKSGDVLLRAADVPVGGGRLGAGDVMVVQPTEGVFAAFNAHCPHQSYMVRPPEQGIMVCLGHGSRFRAEDGSFIDGPALGPLTRVNVIVADGDVVVA